RLDATPANPAIAAIRRRAESASTRVLQMRTTIPATREEAFRLWTDPRAVAHWFLPETGARWITAPVVDATPGGTFDFRAASQSEAFRIFGRFARVEPGRRLVLDWSWETESAILGDGSGTVVTVEFVDADAGTEI